MEAIFKAFPDFVDEFCHPLCTGLKLQNTDSWMAHYVVNIFSTLGIPILPIHDSFIVRKQDADTLIEAMHGAYQQTLEVFDSKVMMKLSQIEDNVVVVRDVSC